MEPEVIELDKCISSSARISSSSGLQASKPDAPEMPEKLNRWLSSGMDFESRLRYFYSFDVKHSASRCHHGPLRGGAAGEAGDLGTFEARVTRALLTAPGTVEQKRNVMMTRQDMEAQELKEPPGARLLFVTHGCAQDAVGGVAAA